MRALFLLVRRSLRRHALSTGVTVFAVALASGLVISVFSIQQQTQEAFTGGDIGFDAVLGARGSALQLVLNTVFHLETSPGNLPLAMYEQIKKDPRVKLAIPYATGDNYLGFRIVGTTPEIFTEFEYQKGRHFAMAQGRRFDPGRREACVGSVAARQTGLKVGDTFQPFHGVVYDAATSERHEEDYVVTGVVKTTNTPSDRVIWIPLEGVYWMGGHVLRGTGAVFTPTLGQPIPEEVKEVSAIMIKFRAPTAGFQLDQEINRQGKVATLAFPIARVMADLFNRIGWMSRVLELVAYLVVLVSGASILAAMYNTINERRREFAILRALGARRRTVFTAIVLESAAIAAIGAVLGLVVYAAILSVAYYIVRAQTGVVLEVFGFHPVLVAAPLGMIALGALAGVIPAIRAYATDVATNLAPHS
jgi:putative ABC transport system permease protein